MTDPVPRARQIAEAHRHLDGPVLPVLHAVQAEFGHIPAETLPEIAHVLDLSRAELHGVVTFYPDFRTAPAGRYLLRVCRGEACQAMGGAELGEALRRALSVDWHETTADGVVTLEPVYCLGLCSCAPAATINGVPRGRAGAEALLAELEK
ncbi:formate dehydrogenase gamma subunit [Rhodovulum bhavnagarense]|uniref:Formate dehydrogenase gamma subunit n=1 Tax=Rhodovulum bhavnagarense TaxID=992286 RepID=A0A4R2RGT8_9RHOB|nr:formate dehydrogenase subunit gamma [Rhodovulum bhavnagarense]TCP61964.1 formate dehydrogenase gamma subunit [Rhodovulum bhavnagarense]